MSVRISRLARASISTAVLLAPVPVPAQVPDGHFVLATATQFQGQGTAWTGPGGLWIGHPRNPGPMVPVTGLPADLVGPPGPAIRGASSVEIHQPSGDLLVGETGANTTIELHRITIDGSFAMTRHSRFVLGTGGDVGQTAQIDPDLVLVTCTDVTGPIGAGPTSIGTVNLSTGVVTPWTQLSAQFTAPYSANAVCVDRARGVAYIGGFNPATVYRVSLGALPPTAGTLLATLPGSIDKLELDAAGNVLAAGRGATDSIFRIDPATRTVTPVLTNWTNAPTLAVEPATGDLLFAGIPAPGSNRHGVYWMPLGAAPTFLSRTEAATGNPPGLPMGLDVAPAPVHYGQPGVTAGTAPPCVWSSVPHPNGLPLVGNPGFRLQMSCTVPAAAAWWFASLGAAPAGRTIPGTTLPLHVDPALVIAVDSLTGGNRAFPIPNDPNLLGNSLYFQALAATAAGIASTEGLRVTFL